MIIRWVMWWCSRTRRCVVGSNCRVLWWLCCKCSRLDRVHCRLCNSVLAGLCFVVSLCRSILLLWLFRISHFGGVLWVRHSWLCYILFLCLFLWFSFLALLCQRFVVFVWFSILAYTCCCWVRLLVWFRISVTSIVCLFLSYSFNYFCVLQFCNGVCG